MGRSSQVKWNKFSGVIEDKGMSAEISLIFDDIPLWSARVSDDAKGWKMSKNFKEGELQDAYDWCISTLNRK